MTADENRVTDSAMQNDDIRLVIVAALGKNNVLGRDNKLIWRLKTDLQRYKKITLGKPMIMGRKTYQSIGRPLPGRQTIVLTHDTAFHAEGVLVAYTVEDALKLARSEARNMKTNEIIIAGGQQIYTLFLPLCNALRLTYVDMAPEGDAWFPEFNKDDFTVLYEGNFPSGPHDDYPFMFVDFERVK